MKPAIMHLQHLSHRKVLDCASPLALSVAPSLTKKRQRTGALQDAVAIAIGRRGLLLGIAISAIGFCAANPANAADFTVHEWGTFTSVQGGDGELLPWRPLQTSDLPDFVHDWTKPGLNRFSLGMLANKGLMVTLQRMETPVIYFHSSESMSVDVSVAFPKGTITEWYPQAAQIGPSLPSNTNAASGALPESRAVWKNLKLVPSAAQYGGRYSLQEDKSGSHYFAARQTAGNLVQMDSQDQTNNVNEAEKFIFYRGAGSFKTPLRVSVDTNNTVTVENTGAEKLSHLFLVSIEDRGFARAGRIAVMNGLSGKTTVKWQRLGALPTADWKIYGPEELQETLAVKMKAALVSEGLYADEARAMVNTWKDSWFTEDGVRVLYILPRPWADETLPLTLNPEPGELKRVMVGRAEIITPDIEASLLSALNSAGKDVITRQHAMDELKRLGRFAGPALQLASRHTSGTNVLNIGHELLSNATHSQFE